MREMRKRNRLFTAGEWKGDEGKGNATKRREKTRKIDRKDEGKAMVNEDR